MMFEGYLLFIITILLGFWLGRSTQPKEDIKEGLSKLKYSGNRFIKDIKYRNTPSQVIQRPDAKRLYDLNNPKIEEEKEEMKRALDEGIQPLTP